MSLQNLGLDGSKSELNNLQVLVKCKPRGRTGAQIWPQILKKHRIKTQKSTQRGPRNTDIGKRYSTTKTHFRSHINIQ